MTDRIKRADVDRIAESISDSLQGSLRLEVQGRNGYTAVDLADDNGCIELLAIGSKPEVYRYLQGMRRALWIVGRDN